MTLFESTQLSAHPQNPTGWQRVGGVGAEGWRSNGLLGKVMDYTKSRLAPFPDWKNNVFLDLPDWSRFQIGWFGIAFSFPDWPQNPDWILVMTTRLPDWAFWMRVSRLALISRLGVVARLASFPDCKNIVCISRLTGTPDW